MLDFLTGATEDSAAGNIHHPVGEGPAAKRARTGGAAGVGRSSGKGSGSSGAGGGGSGGKDDAGRGGGASGRAGASAGGGAAALASSRGGGGGGGRIGSGVAQTSYEEAGRDRNGLLSLPGQDFTFALRLYSEAHSAAKKKEAQSPGAQATGGSSASGAGSGSGSARSSSSTGASGSKKKGSDDRLPIIVVPSASNSLITLLNVRQLLEGTNANTS